MVGGAQYALTLRFLDQPRPASLLIMAAIDGVVGSILLFLVALHLHRLTRERSRNAIIELLVDALSVPATLEDAGRIALLTLTDSRVADAGVIAALSGTTEADDTSETLIPLATTGGRRGWEPAPARAAGIPPAPTTRREEITEDPWLLGLEGSVGRRPWVARIPITRGDEVLGLLLLATRTRSWRANRGWLRDRALLQTAGTLLAAALDHGRQYQVASERTRDLEEQNASRREFLYAIAHELRSPLTSIQAFAELLTTDRMLVDGNSELLIASLSRGVDRLAMFVNDLLDLGRAEEAGLQVSTSVIDVTDALRSAETILRPSFMSRDQALTLELPDAPLLAIADSRALKQVMLNLLSNANRFTPSQGTVGVRAGIEDGRVRIQVQDSGPGIDPVDRIRIFDAFYRVHCAGAHEVPGSGLGLAVARRLTEMQGGRIWVEAGEPSGSRFCIELPAADDEPVAEPAQFPTLAP